MQVWELTRWSRDGLRRTDRPNPVAGFGEVVVRMEAVALNYRDLVLIDGGYGRAGGRLPIVPASDGAGRILEVGDGVEASLVGKLVVPSFFQSWRRGRIPADARAGALGGPLDGVLQERLRLPAAGTVAAPDGWSAVEASTLPCAALTAWRAVAVLGRTRPGDVVVVEGTGGVACFAIQFAHRCGAHVVVVSSSDAKLAAARDLGAGTLINYRRTPQWGKTVRDLVRAADLVVELGGADTIGQALRAVRPGGTLALIGVLSGSTAALPLGPAVTREIRLQSVTCGSRDDLADLVRALNAGPLRPVIDRTYPFAAFPDALDRLQSARHVGKVCVEGAA